MMRILVLNQYFHPDRSATSQLLTELCEDLARYHQVFVVTGRPSYNVSPGAALEVRGTVSKEWHGSVRVARVWSTSFDRSGMAGRLANYGTYLLSSVAGAFSVAKPDVVVALTDPPPIGLVGSFTAHVRRIPFVLVAKDIFPDVAIQLGMLRNPAAIALLRRIKHVLFDSADRVVSIGRDMDRRLIELGVSEVKVATIHDWADGATIRPLDSPSRMRADMGWADRFVVMHSGNVGLSQDLGTVLEAAALLRDERRVLFAIVGEGAAKARLQQEAERLNLENVVFIRFQDKEDLSDSLGAADIHLVTLREGLSGFITPSKVYGILAAGKPFVAAVDPGSEPDAIAREHDCGFSIPPGDPKLLASTIVTAMGSDLGTMGVDARQAFERRFDRRIAAEAYRSLLEDVVTTTGVGSLPSQPSVS